MFVPIVNFVVSFQTVVLYYYSNRQSLLKLHFLLPVVFESLADLAHFHQVVSSTHNLTRANKWIAFGGSYAGSLAAWVRIKVS